MNLTAAESRRILLVFHGHNDVIFPIRNHWLTVLKESHYHYDRDLADHFYLAFTGSGRQELEASEQIDEFLNELAGEPFSRLRVPELQTSFFICTDGEAPFKLSRPQIQKMAAYGMDLMLGSSTPPGT